MSQSAEPTPHDLVQQLDIALHGFTKGRPVSPSEVWQDLLQEVRELEALGHAAFYACQAIRRALPADKREPLAVFEPPAPTSTVMPGTLLLRLYAHSRSVELRPNGSGLSLTLSVEPHRWINAPAPAESHAGATAYLAPDDIRVLHQTLGEWLANPPDTPEDA